MSNALTMLNDLIKVVHDYDQLGPVTEYRFADIERELRSIYSAVDVVLSASPAPDALREIIRLAEEIDEHLDAIMVKAEARVKQLEQERDSLKACVKELQAQLDDLGVPRRSGKEK